MNIKLLIGVILMVISVAYSVFLGVEQTMLVEIAVIVVGAVLALKGVLEKHPETKNNVYFYVDIAVLVVGIALGALGGLDENTTVELIGAVVLIFGLIAIAITGKLQKKAD